MRDQEHHQIGVLARYAVLSAEGARVGAAEQRMVAAATLGDVVKQGGDIQQPVALETGDQARTQGILVCELEHGEAAHIAHHHQDVLVHRVYVEQVMLHLADDALERRQVAPENSPLVHAAQFMHQTARALQQRHEHRAVGRGAAERAIHPVARAPQGAQGWRGHALEIGALLQQMKAFEQGARFGFKYRRVAGGQHVALDVKTLVDRVGLESRSGKQLAGDVLQQDGVQLDDPATVDVVALHQGFAGPP